MATYLNGKEISIVTLGSNVEVDKLTTRINKLETELAIYTVKVLVNVDGKVAEYYVEKGKTLALDNPVKENFTFLGWYVGLELINLTTHIFDKDTVITAQFEDNRVELPDFICNLNDFTIDGDTITKYNGLDDYVEIPASYSIEARDIYQDGVKVNRHTIMYFENITIRTLDGEILTFNYGDMEGMPDTFYLLNITTSSAYDISNMFYEYSDFPILFNGMVMNSYEEIDQYCMDNYSITDFDFQGNINKDIKVPGEDVLITTLAEGTFGETSCYGVKISKNISSISYSSVGSGMFGRNLNLSTVVVDKDNPTFDSRNNCNAIIQTSTNKLMFGCKTTVIPDTVTSIGKNAFYLVPIIHVVIPANIKTVENQAFGYSRTILSVTLLGNPTFSGSFVFGGCERLYEVYSVGGKEITLPSHINDIKDGSIARYAKVIHTSLDEPSNYHVSNNHIYFVYGDEYIFMGVTQPNIKNIVIDPKTTTIAYSCFVGAGQVDTVSLTGCTKLTTLEDCAFDASWMCTLNFTELDLTDCINLSKIGWGIASSNTNLKKVSMGAITPPTRTSTSALFNNNLKQIAVPDESVSAYKQAAGWSDYADIITDSTTILATNCNLFTFDGDTITSYTGDETDVTIPTSYSIVGEETSEEEFHDFWMLLDYINMNGISYPINITDGDNIEYIFYDEMELHDTLNMHAYPPFKMSTTKPTYGNGTDYVITSIGREAFQECTNLTSVTIPNGITTIGANAFSHCNNLTTLNLPKTLTNIDSSAFWYMDGLQYITMQGESDRYTVIDNALIDKTESTLMLGCKNTVIPTNITTIGQMSFAYSGITELVVPKNITTIGGSAFLASSLSSIIFEAGSELSSIASSAFLHCRNLTTITIPKNVTTLKSSTFSSCGISSIYFEEGSKLTTIESQAFDDCDSLTHITFPDSVTTVAENAFYGCANILSVTISKNITSIGGNICQQCNSLTTIIVESGNPVYDSRNNCNAVIETATNTLVMGCKDTNIPAGIKHIGDNAFKNCYPLTNITIPSGIITIGTRAFYQCTQLATVDIPDTVTSLGDFTFYGCSALTNIIIPDSVLSIGQQSFWNCKNLVSVYLPANLTIINSHTFELCKKLSTINIPEGVTSIGVGAFTECNSLTSITLPNSLTTIETQAFWVCSGLTTITIPANVTKIGNSAFASCKKLTSMTMLSVTPPTISSGTIPSNVTKIYIPTGTLSAYQSANIWKNYSAKFVEN